ncbi:MAG TPA: ECF transporter S component [Chloroflexi bacterium]|nr:ECF transporter S component [Chloroflexota bacterium]
MRRIVSGLIYGLSGAIGVLAFLYPFFAPMAGGTTTGIAHSQDAPLVTAVLVGLSVSALIVELQGRSLSAKTVAMLGILVAVTSVLRFLEVAFPMPGGFSPIFAPIIIAGYVFGGRFGFLMGAFTLLVSGLITGGVGPWLPYQMFTAGWAGLTAGWLGRMSERAKERISERANRRISERANRRISERANRRISERANRRESESANQRESESANRRESESRFTSYVLPTKRQVARLDVLALCAFGFIWGLLYGAIMNIYFWPFAMGPAEQTWSPGIGLGETLARYGTFYVVTSLAWDLVRSVGNALMILLLGAPVIQALTRFRRRFHFEVRTSDV